MNNSEALEFLGEVMGDPGRHEPAELIDALLRIRELRAQLLSWEPVLIDAARTAGVSWAELAPALGVASRQAAERRYLRITPHATDPTLNGEQRIQAARDQRANDRAIADWAHENAADLRRLAGQIAALRDLDSTTQASVDRVHDALADNDSAALLGPLTDAAVQLTADHPALAGRINEVTDRTGKLRSTRRSS